MNDKDYFSKKNSMKYCSASQLKMFKGVAGMPGCEAKAMADIKGEYERPFTEAFLIGQYLDCCLTEPEKLEEFKNSHPEMYSSRGATKGELKSQYARVNQMVERVKKDKFFMKTLEGDKQKIMTGELFGVPFKIKMDIYMPGKYITDLKSCESIKKGYFNPIAQRKETFVEYFDYITQGAIYTAIVEQNTGKKLPFFLSCISKEPTTDLEVIQIDNETLDEKLEELKPLIIRVGQIKKSEIPVCRCGVCDYCLNTKVLKAPIHFTEIMGVVGNE